MFKRKYVIGQITTIFEKYGFEPLETPTIEMWETLSGKYGEEGDRLTYRFTDRGDRDVGLRYDLTVPLSRVAAMYPNLPKPFKRYQIQPVWRADKPQKGRYREFFQCDVDIIGSRFGAADAEIIAIINEILTVLTFKGFKIRLNNRSVLNGLVEATGGTAEMAGSIFRSIDKLDKIGLGGVEKEMLTREIPENTVQKLLEILEVSGSSAEKLDEMERLLEKSEIGRTGIAEMRALIAQISAYGVPDSNVEFDICLARGLDYYTGPIFETVVEEPKIGSICAGGRYDKLVGMFSGQDIPATGGSIGLERIITVMDELDMYPEGITTSTKVLVSVFDASTISYSIKLAASLRAAGINTDLYTGKAKLRGQFGFADDKQIPLIIIAGPDEEAAGKVTLKDMRSGEQTQVESGQLVDKVLELL